MLFFSYTSIEVEFALKLATDLQNLGVAIWLDRLKGGIRGGDDWITRIQDALDNCVGLIAVVSPKYITSKYCKRELLRADKRNVPIFPVLLSHLTSPNDWPLTLQEKQYIDFTNWHDTQIYEAKLRDLIDAIQLRISDVVNSIPDLDEQYLNTLLSDLESKRGVLEFV